MGSPVPVTISLALILVTRISTLGPPRLTFMTRSLQTSVSTTSWWLRGRLPGESYIRKTPSQLLRNWKHLGTEKSPGTTGISSMHFEALPVLTVSSKHVDEPLVLLKHLDKFQTLSKCLEARRNPYNNGDFFFHSHWFRGVDLGGPHTQTIDLIIYFIQTVATVARRGYYHRPSTNKNRIMWEPLTQSVRIMPSLPSFFNFPYLLQDLLS